MTDLADNKRIVVDYYMTAFAGDPEKAAADLAPKITRSIALAYSSVFFLAGWAGEGIPASLGRRAHAYTTWGRSTLPLACLRKCVCTIAAKGCYGAVFMDA